MPKADLTRLSIAAALKNLMRNTPLDKISVQDITQASGLNRKTFYYHFRDKQDLVCWIFDHEFAGLTDTNHNNTVIDELLEHLYANKRFYIAALTSNAQNNLCEHLFTITFEGMTAKIQTMLDDRTMPPDFICSIANYFSNAVVGCISQWAREGMKMSPKEYNILFHPITEECLEFIIRKYYQS